MYVDLRRGNLGKRSDPQDVTDRALGGMRAGCRLELQSQV